MKNLLLCLALAVSFTAFAADKLNDTKAMQGTWKPAKAELAGQPWSDAILKTITLKLDDTGNYLVTVGESPPDKGTCALDPTSKPKGMSVTGISGPNKGKTFPAIYELEGDTLRICYDLSGAKRPASFKTSPGTQLYLVTYHRQKE
jgi:uncharacterized protein (TIGR03067 family)